MLVHEGWWLMQQCSKCSQGIWPLFIPNREVCVDIKPGKTPASVGRFSGKTPLGVQGMWEKADPQKWVNLTGGNGPDP